MVTLVALAASTMLHALELGVAAAAMNERATIARDPFVLAELESTLLLLEGLGALSLLIAGPLFIAWTYRCRAVVPDKHQRYMLYGRGWVIGGWLVPFLNLVRPKQVLDQIWFASDQDASDAVPHRARRLPRWGTAWWATCVTMLITGRVIDAASTRGPLGREDLSLVLGLTVLGGLSAVAAGALAIHLVLRLTERQTATTGQRPPWAPVRIAGATGVTAFTLTALVALVPGSLDAATTIASLAVPPTPAVLDLRVPGTCFDDPRPFGLEGEPALTPCHLPHDFEVVAHIDPKAEGLGGTSVEPFTDAALERCETIVDDAGLLGGELDFYLFAPEAEEWRSDPWLSCVVYRLDGGQLMGPITVL